METQTNPSPTKVKCLICQLNAKPKDIDYNIARLETSLAKYSPADQIDFILLPEMIFTGYHFLDKNDIEPYLERQTKGKTFDFCSKIAKKINCYIFCGYPELEIDSNTGTKHFFNSAYIIDRKGELLLNYRKHFLYTIDHRWAEPGTSFKSFTFTTTENKVLKAVPGICMDINPYEFKDESLFEFANFVKNEKADVVLFSTAWKDSDDKEQTGNGIKELLNYWIYRLSPLITSDKNPKMREDGYKRWALFLADRVGKEEDTVFAGCSSALKFNPLKFIGCLDKRNEGFLLAEVLLD